MKYYLVCKKELPAIEHEDVLVGHVTISVGYDTVYPKIQNMKEMKMVEGNDYVSSILIYEVEMESVENKFIVDTDFYFFRLSHHNRRSREYYDELLRKGKNIMDDKTEYSRWARMRFDNGVRGNLYRDLHKAEESFERELKFRDQIEKDRRRWRFEEYQKLKLEFEQC